MRGSTQRVRSNPAYVLESYRCKLSFLFGFNDLALKTKKLDKNGEVFNTEELINCIWDFFLPGTETSSTTLKWAVLYLTLHPEVQQRCREEIQEVVGEGRLAVAHLPSLPYLQATIAEVQRVSRVAPLSLPHYTTAPTTADTFTFPTNSMFFANLSFIMNDPTHFKDPHVFRPERFLSSEGR